MCSDGVSCSTDRFCATGSLSESTPWNSESLEQPGVPVIKLIGNNIIEVKQVCTKWSNFVLSSADRQGFSPWRISPGAGPGLQNVCRGPGDHFSCPVRDGGSG